MKTIIAKEDQAIYFYRYTSLSLTSLVYLLGDRDPPFLIKSAVILVLFISVKGLSDVYRKSDKVSNRFKVTIGIEMAGMIGLLLATGGMESSFLWCIMNPMLIAASYLSPLFCWLIIWVYTLTVTLFSSLMGSNKEQTLGVIIWSNGDFYLVLLLMTLAIHLLAGVHSKLERANNRTTETMEHIKSLYQIVEAATQSESGNLRMIFADFALKLTKQQTAFFWDVNGNEGVDRLMIQGVRNSADEAALCSAIELNLKGLRREDSSTLINLPGHGEFLVMPVKSTTRFWGVLGIKVERWSHEEGRKWFVQQLYFLSELCAVILERHQLERMENQLMIIEEQNRIADEMHDSVSQHMFGIVYAIHSLNRNWKHISEDKMREQLQLIQESSHMASQELRSTIYSLSSRKSGGAFWLSTVKSHLDSLSKLQAVEIDLKVTGDDHRLPVNHQKALFRIISEAAGNGIRHGCSSSIIVELSLKASEAKLVVTDNGDGFDVAKQSADPQLSGLGLANMKSLAHSLGGIIEINSQPGTGTQILVCIPI
ncbi:Sensor histidine kinase LiaS [compost metagenome]